jgi:hypothetical protein
VSLVGENKMAASNGTMVIQGASGKVYSIDTYVPDATGTLLTFNPTGLAGSTSPSQMVIPENGFIVDYVQVAAPTAVGFNIKLDSASVNGGTLRHANQLNSLATRQKLRIPVGRGQILSALQF